MSSVVHFFGYFFFFPFSGSMATEARSRRQVLVSFSAIVPLMTVVNYSVQDILGPDQRVFVGIELILMVGSMLGGGGAWISVVSQLGGALGGYLMLLYWRWRPPSFKRKKSPPHIRRVH